MDTPTRVRIKICGLTTSQAAQAAVEAGADALGFVFYPPSSRYIDPASAGAIIRQLPPFVQTVGLFVNHSIADINAIRARAALDLLQFHGDESAAFCDTLHLPYIKAVRVHSEACIPEAEQRYSSARALLADACVPGTYGGSGHTVNWPLIPGCRDKPLVLAGGLCAENVAEAVAAVRPYAVDVSGGVESAAGVKCVHKIHRFCNALSP